MKGVVFYYIYPKDTDPYQKDICSTMFRAALFVTARTWKQPRCSSSEEWIKKNMVPLHNGVLLSGKTKNNDILKFACKWMELEKNILSKVTQTQRDKHGMYSLINGY